MRTLTKLLAAAAAIPLAAGAAALAADRRAGEKPAEHCATRDSHKAHSKARPGKIAHDRKHHDAEDKAEADDE